MQGEDRGRDGRKDEGEREEMQQCESSVNKIEEIKQ